ncbi:hypothetical protein BT69DRAFT_1346789 [Atractiella rhizophila]|nr:hypothetical protein BT69DRAFT_1346789 [Atractiella rhizophila]
MPSRQQTVGPGDPLSNVKHPSKLASSDLLVHITAQHVTNYSFPNQASSFLLQSSLVTPSDRDAHYTHMLSMDAQDFRDVWSSSEEMEVEKEIRREMKEEDLNERFLRQQKEMFELLEGKEAAEEEEEREGLIKGSLKVILAGSKEEEEEGRRQIEQSQNGINNPWSGLKTSMESGNEQKRRQSIFVLSAQGIPVHPKKVSDTITKNYTTRQDIFKHLSDDVLRSDFHGTPNSENERAQGAKASSIVSHIQGVDGSTSLIPSFALPPPRPPPILLSSSISHPLPTQQLNTLASSQRYVSLPIAKETQKEKDSLNPKKVKGWCQQVGSWSSSKFGIDKRSRKHEIKSKTMCTP